MTFVSGLELARSFYFEVVAPLLDREVPNLPYSAALIGGGSEVIGFDDEQSTDHGWGPRAMLFFSEEDLANSVRERIVPRLPASFHGYSTEIRDAPKTVLDTFTLAGYFERLLALDITRPLTWRHWLRLPSQGLLETTSGEVFRDDLGLIAVRNDLAFYPDDVWLYLVSCQWTRIGQEEAFVGRCAQAGDELGSQVVTARLVRDLMKLCFLLERQYAPYSKWLGSAFSRLPIAAELAPILRGALSAPLYPERERELCRAYSFVAELHNSKGITEPLDPAPIRFHERPFRVLGADRFAQATRRAISDPVLRQLETNAGGIDQFVDSTDVLSCPKLFHRFDLWS